MQTENNNSFPEHGERELERLIDQLSRVVKDREEEFLDLGSAVQQHATASADLSSKAVQMAEATSSEAVDTIIGKLESELKSMMELANVEETRRNIDQLEQVGNDVVALSESVGEFKGVIRRLQMLGISTRIESARLGSQGRGFSTLADDVERLAVNIEGHSSDILERAKILGNLVSRARQESTSMCANQENTSKSVFAQLREDMERLSSMAHKSEKASDDLSGLTAGISNNIGEIIASLQFHDMARQQIEHVEEALHEVVGVFREKDEKYHETNLELIGWCGDVCTLQTSQIHHTAEHFLEAVERIRDHLRQTSVKVSEVALLAQSLAAGDSVGNGEDAGSPLDRTEASLGHIIECMRGYAEQGEEIGRLMASVAQTVDDMAIFLQDIEEVGSEIELIALNASIKAAHTGEEGKALGVLALAIQGLSLAAREQTEAVTSVLRSIHDSAETLKKSADSFMDTSQISEVIVRLEGFVEELRQGNREFEAMSVGIGAGSQSLADQLENLADSLAFHHDVTAGLEAIRVDVETLATQALSIAPPDGNASRSERLSRMLDRYTMEAERMVHEGATSASGATGGGSADDSDIELFDTPAGDDGLGDNIELF